MVMITTLFVAALAGFASAAPTPQYSGSSSGYDSSAPAMSSSYGSSGSSSYGSSGSSSYGSSSSSESASNSSSSGCDASSGCGSASTTTTMAAEMSMSTASSMPMYGSGSSSYGSSSSSSGSSYDGCVQQCVAQFGQPSSMGSMSSSPTYSSNATMTMGSTGTGATHTVIVAPTKGVLRYVPFAVNASVGDTVMFMWGAGPHTVTKSSVLDVCNKTDDQAFSSGQQNASFVFTQVVNDTNPTFYYCGVPGHCQKGMFGIINPPNAAAQPSSVANMLPGIAANTSAVSTSWASTKNYTGAASTWGGSMDLSGMPGWAQSAMAENVLFTRSVMAANPSAITANGDINLGQIDLANMMIPADVAALAAASAPASNSSSATSGTNPAAPSSTSSSSVNNAATTSGAGALASPRSAVALVAAAVMFFAL